MLTGLCSTRRERCSLSIQHVSRAGRYWATRHVGVHPCPRSSSRLTGERRGNVTSCLFPAVFAVQHQERGVCVCRGNILRSWCVRIVAVCPSSTSEPTSAIAAVRVHWGLCTQANILICQPGDIGHVLRTIGTRRRHPQHTINVGAQVECGITKFQCGRCTVQTAVFDWTVEMFALDSVFRQPHRHCLHVEYIRQ